MYFNLPLQCVQCRLAQKPLGATQKQKQKFYSSVSTWHRSDNNAVFTNLQPGPTLLFLFQR